MNSWREFAKFACGAEAFHAFLHSALWFSGTTIAVFGIEGGPSLQFVGALVNAMFAIVLGIYAWRPFGNRAT